MLNVICLFNCGVLQLLQISQKLKVYVFKYKM